MSFNINPAKKEEKTEEASISITGNRLHFMLPADYGMAVYVK